MKQAKLIPLLAAVLLPAPFQAARGADDLSRARIFQEAGWTGHLVYAGSPADPVRCEVAMTAEEADVTLTFIRELGGRASLKVAFSPARVEDLENFNVLVRGQPIRGPKSYDAGAAWGKKQFLGYDHGITRSILQRFREADELTFPPGAVDLPAIKVDGIDNALARLDGCPDWKP